MGFAEGDELKMMLMGMKRFTKVEPFNCKESRQVAAELIDKMNIAFSIFTSWQKEHNH